MAKHKTSLTALIERPNHKRILVNGGDVIVLRREE